MPEARGNDTSIDGGRHKGRPDRGLGPQDWRPGLADPSQAWSGTMCHPFVEDTGSASHLEASCGKRGPALCRQVLILSQGSALGIPPSPHCVAEQLCPGRHPHAGLRGVRGTPEAHVGDSVLIDRPYPTARKSVRGRLET